MPLTPHPNALLDSPGKGSIAFLRGFPRQVQREAAISAPCLLVGYFIS